MSQPHTPGDHPSLDSLRRYAQAALTEKMRQVIDAHLEGCETCAAQVTGIQEQQPSVRARLGVGPDEAMPEAGKEASDWQPPEQIDEYRLEERLGAGGMGIVYRAKDQYRQCPVALKFLPPERNDPAARARFLAEAQWASKVNHVNVVRVLKYGEFGERKLPYLVMEFVPGESLAERLQQLRTLPPREAARIVSRVARGLAAAHAQGLLHRDIKPSNILMRRENDEPVLVDFGLACPVERPPDRKRLTESGHILGTAAYMSPEHAQMVPAPVTEASDVYSLGVVLYEALTGNVPFPGEVWEVLLAHVDQREPARPRGVRPEISRDLETICLKCLAREPLRRYARAAELADDLCRFLDGEPIKARPTSRLTRAWRFGRRHPVQVGVALLLLFLAFAVGSVPELWATNKSEAEKLALRAEKQLWPLEDAVLEVARNEELRQGVVKFKKDNRKDFLGLLKGLKDNTHHVRFRRRGEKDPFESFGVMDLDGRFLGDTQTTDPDDPLYDRAYGYRDYARQPLGPHGAYCSRAFRSLADEKWRFCVVAPILNKEREGGKLIGRIIGGVVIDAQMLALDMRPESPGAMVIGLVGPDPEPGQVKEGRDWIVVFHKEYDLQGPTANPKWADDRAAVLQTFLSDPGQSHAAKRFCFRNWRPCFADYARVGNRHFIAVVEQPYSVQVIGIVGLAVIIVIATVGSIFWRWAQRLPMRFQGELPAVPGT